MAKSETRSCGVEGCERPYSERGFCGLHVARWRRHGDPLGGRPERRDHQTTLEEVLWLREGGASPYETMAALGTSAATLARTMQRVGRPDLAAWLQPEMTWAQRLPA
jgi:hypothetical protein